MIVSLLFSFAIYSGVDVELRRFERTQALRALQNPYGQEVKIFRPKTGDIQRILIPPADEIDPEIVNHARTRIILILVIINLTILGFSGIAGYVLAGHTLQPIQDMVEEQNRFVTDASHELRTPLTALRSEIEVNLRDKKLTLAAAKELLQSNLEEVKNLQQLSDNLIQLTQHQADIESLTFQSIALSTIVDDAVKKVLPLAKAKKITIRQQLPDVQLDANVNLLGELFVILLDNAIKYSPKETMISITGSTTVHQVKVVVTDQGIGIEKKDLPYIFDRFYRADKSRTQTETPGYGLGLSIAKNIVKKHNGSISAESVLQKGTSFTVDLPLKQT